MTPSFKFLRRVRIHGGECGAVARALHHEAQKVALIQNEQSLISDECVLLSQADLGKSSRSTFIERKQMSTKTTLKRIALVAVSALGFGMMSVVPSNGTALSSSTNYVTDIAFSVASVPVAGNAGDAVQTKVYFKTSTTAEVHVLPKVTLISSPSTSSMASVAQSTAVTKGKYSFTTGALNNTTNVGATGEAAVDLTVATTDVDGTGIQVNRASDLTKYTYETTYFNAWYDVAGTYKWVFWNDTDDSGTINGSEYSEVHSVIAADGTAELVATITPFNSTSGVDSTSGSLVKICLAAGANAGNVDSAGGVKVTVSGSAVISASSAATYIVPRESFNGSGCAWINVTNSVAEVVSVTVSGVGSTTVTGTAKSLTFVTSAGNTSGQVSKGSSTAAMSAVSSNAATFGIGKSISMETNATALTSSTSVYDDVDVTDTFGIITGKAGAAYSLAVSPTQTCTTYCGTFSIATGGAVDGQTFTVTINTGTAVTFTSAAASATGGNVNVLQPGSTTYGTAEVLTMAKLGSVTVTLRARDQFSAVRAGVSLSASLSSTSRNYGQNLASVYTGSAGTVAFTFTDANTAAGTSLTDVITFSDGTNSATLTITYTDADLGISTMVMDTNDTDAYGDNLATITPVAIDTGDGTEGGRSAVTVTIKNEAGTLLNGIPVTWSVAGGSGVALYLPTGNISYSAAGVATASVYAWVAGTYTVTATAGGKSASEQITFASTTNTNARVISATVKDNVVTGKAVDRFGNPVKNVVILAKTSGGYFGSGVTSTQGTTGSDGTVDFVLLGNSGKVTISVDGATYTQTTAIAGSSDNTADGEYSATVAATASAAAYYVGTALAPAGVNSVTVDVTVGASAATVAAEAATDAAAEAIDAANAATDAANLAAEAADAATVAAEEARDAADAATAAVEELATQVATLMAALKAQITTLANTVAKIAKKVKA